MYSYSTIYESDGVPWADLRREGGKTEISVPGPPSFEWKPWDGWIIPGGRERYSLYRHFYLWGYD